MKRFHVHRAWLIALVTFGALLCAAGFRSSTGVLMEPLENEFGWSRELTSAAVTLNLVVFGLTAPFAAALMEKFGIRRVVASALCLVAVGSGLTVLMTASWQLVALWGLAVGLGTGAMALVLGAIVANRWFVRHRGLVTGLFSAASATGQLIFLPWIAYLAVHVGWRWSAGVVAGAALLLVPLVLLFLADRPSDVGSTAYGEAAAAEQADPDPDPPTNLPAGLPTDQSSGQPTSAARLAVHTLRQSLRSPAFWILACTFFICGWSTNGLIGTHFVPAAHDHGMPVTTAANLLAVIGIFDIVGTVASGWLTDRVDPRLLLVVYYGLRGLSLLVVPALLGPSVHPNLFLFIVFYGLDWVATVPPTIALCRSHFGLERSSIVFGWVYASHMIGAGIAATFAGTIRERTGSYEVAWWTAGALCLAAAVAVLGIPTPGGRRARARELMPTPVG
ncbi:MFS transporter [Angustibacter sp. McL0619]|uniref:MFS transporter n=1 Tax=Angustibacter sp. McL0619 TaxID=3415676 RepID=UPI003CF234EB